MKNFYTPEEVSLFLNKLKMEIEADYVIMEATKPQTETLMTFQDTLEAIHTIGMKQGSLSGRMDTVSKFLDFFEI